MALGIVVAYFLLLLLGSAFGSAASDQSPLSVNQEVEQPNLQAIRIRNATLADLDDITDTFFEAFSSAPTYRYSYQFREQFAAYHWRCMRAAFQHFMDAPFTGSFILKVIDFPTNEDHNTSKVVAIALWEYPATRSTGIPGVLFADNCTQHLDANMTRAIYTQRQFDAAKRRYLDNVYPPEHQLYLNILATHPDYQGRGLGEAHCEWGLALAKQKLADAVDYVTLIATPRGFPIYQSLGFESLTNMTIKGVDEQDEFWFMVMKLDTK